MRAACSGRDELAVGEDLEITIRMLGGDVEQALVHEGFAAEDSEKAVAGLAGLADEPVQMIRLDLLLFRRHIAQQPDSGLREFKTDM